MKKLLVVPLVLATCVATLAGLMPVDLQPPGGEPGDGLNPPDGVTSDGTGNEIESGIVYDSESGWLMLVVGYGSSAGFTDLSGAATAIHIHGPDPTDPTTEIVLFNLEGVHFLNTDPTTGGIVRGAVLYDEAQKIADLLAGNHYINIHTAGNAGGEIRGNLIVQANAAPTVSCPEPMVLECTSLDGTEATITVLVGDADGDALEVVWTMNGVALKTEQVPAADPGAPTQAEVTLIQTLCLGDHVITATVSDGMADPVSCDASVTVQDTTPPVVDSIYARPHILWPPNHKLKTVVVRVVASDTCSEVTSKIVSITSNEPVDDKGDGRTEPDWSIVGDLKAKLRAERSGKGDGRVYTLTVETTDAEGNATTDEVKVRVPHDARGKTR